MTAKPARETRLTRSELAPNTRPPDIAHRCAWCGDSMQAVEPAPAISAVSHGLCPECRGQLSADDPRR